MSVPLMDLREQHAALHDELVAAFASVLATTAFVGGEAVQIFESEFAAYCEVNHAIGVANGTDALALALRALDIGPGSAVAVPAFTFAATAEAVCHVGAVPVFVDVDPHTLTMGPQSLQTVLGGSRLPVKAVIPVHLYGQPADMDPLLRLADACGAVVLEDAAQAHGARYRGKRCGGLGRIAAFSFYPTKNLGALGDGGALTTNDAVLAQRLRELRDHGQRQKYLHAVVGFNSRLDTLQAAALRIKLRHLDAWNTARQAHAARYRERLEGLAGISLLRAEPHSTHVYHLFVIRCQQRDGLRAFLQEQGIASAIHYPLALHQQEAFASTSEGQGSFPVAERAAAEVVALPMYPELPAAAVDAVCAAVAAWARESRV